MLIKQHAPTTMALHLRWLFATDDDRMVPVCVRMHCMFAILPGINSPKSVALNALLRRSVQNIFVILSTVVLVLRISFVFFECYAIATEVATVSIHSLPLAPSLSLGLSVQSTLSISNFNWISLFSVELARTRE